MITVVWPSYRAKRAHVWRVLDLAGLTAHPQASKQAFRAGCVFLNGERLWDIRHTVEIGTIFTLEIRFQNGKIITKELFLVNQMYGTHHQQRSAEPLTRYYRG